MHRLDFATNLTSAESGGTERPRHLSDADLRSLYAYPEPLDTPWMRVNFVSSIDGAVTVDGASAGLGSPADKQVFGLLRELADVIVVGAGTVRAENYGGARISDEGRRWRLARGVTPTPPIAVVSASARLDPHSRLFSDTTVAPLILTGSGADPAQIDQLREAGGDVVVLSAPDVSAAALLEVLEDRGLRRVLCEGGPGLFGTLLTEGAVDELCLTTAPLLVAGVAARIAASAHASPTAMRRAHVLADDDGALLTRWVRHPTP